MSLTKEPRGLETQADSCGGGDLTENEKDAQCEEDHGECQSANPQGLVVWGRISFSMRRRPAGVTNEAGLCKVSRR